ASTAASPTFSPGPGTYTTAQSVTISDSTPSSTIYYTTNGTTPTTGSTVYSSAITVSASETVEAIATATGLTNSAVASAIYTIQAATPTFSPGPGTYTTAQSVTISDSTPGSTIYYTTNGTAPTTGSTVYSGAITVSVSETVKAIATAAGYGTSAVASAAYTIQAATPTFSPVSGTYATAQSVTISDTTAGVTIYYTVTQGTTGTTPTTASTLYNPGGTGPFTVFNPTVHGAVTVEALAVKTGDQNSTVGTVLYYFDPPAVAEPTFSPVAGIYNGVQTVTISDATAGASIYYTVTSGTTGTTPTTASTPYTVPISVTPTSVVEALAVKTSYVNSTVAEATYTQETAAPTPTFSPVGGTYGVAQNVSIGDAVAGAVIYYTTDGTTPLTSSAIFSLPIHVVGALTPTTIKA